MLVSIIMPVRNGMPFVADALRSLAAQTYGNFELIVVDGQSTDGTSAEIRRHTWVSRHINERDHGMYDALAKGLKIARGDVVGYLNADDILTPRALEIVVDIFRKFETVRWLCGHISACHENGACFVSRCGPAYDRHRLFDGGHNAYGYPVPQESTFWRRELLAALDYDKLASFRLAGDAYLWSEFAKRETLFVVDAQLGMFRVRKGQLSSDVGKYRGEIVSQLGLSWTGRVAAKFTRAWMRLPRRMRMAIFKSDYIAYSRQLGDWACLANHSRGAILRGRL